MARARNLLKSAVSARLSAIVIIAGIAIAVAPFAHAQIGGDSAVTIFTVIIFAELLTSFLLFQRFMVERDLRLLVLGSTYLVSGLIFVGYQLVAPGVFDENAVLTGPSADMGAMMDPARAMGGAPMKGAVPMKRSAPMEGAEPTKSAAPMDGATPMKGGAAAMESGAPMKGGAAAMESPAPMEGGAAAMEGPAPMEGGAAAMEGPAPMDGRSEIGDGPLSSGDGTRPTGKMLTGFIAQMWLWIAAHTVFPLGILATLAIGRFKATPVVGTRLRHARIAVASASFVMIGVAALLTIAALHFQAQLPRIMQEGPPALPLNVIALPIALWLGWRSGKIERWALVALTASVADVVLTRIASEPFTLGWYGGRLLNVAAATVLLVALVAEISRLYGRLAVAHDRLSIQAAHDALTGALTRTAVLAEAEELLRRAREANRPTTLAILDVDHFKQINDVHGHLVGDRVLVALAERMGAGLREKDLLGRYGGEEFILLIRDASETTGRAIAARVQEHVRTEPIPTPSGGVHVTVSIGLTDLRPGDRSIEDVLERADGSLYAAKERGRDRIVYDFAPTAQLQPALARAPGSSLPRPA